MRLFIYAMPFLGSLAATLALIITFAGSRSAPQEAAGFAMACALAIVPYVFARSIDLCRDDRENQLKRSTRALEEMARVLTAERKDDRS